MRLTRKPPGLYLATLLLGSLATSTPLQANHGDDFVDDGARLSLRFDTYSSTTAELFWSRLPGSDVRYDVSANGVPLDSVTNTSYFYDCIPPGEAVDFEVVALDGDDSILIAETITVFDPSVSLGSSPWSPPTHCLPILEAMLAIGEPVPDIGASELELRVITYSSTAAELFWTRLGPGLVYSVSGAGIETDFTEGNSYFLDGLTPGREYRITVQTIDGTDIESIVETIGFTLDAAGDQQTSVVEIPNDTVALPGYDLEASIEVYSSQAFELFWNRLPGQTVMYEVSVGNRAPVLLDALSLYVDGLTPGTRYPVQVFAFDEQRLSNVETFEVTLPGEVTSASATERELMLRGEVYSARSVELFWEALPGSGRFFEVRVNGVAVDTLDGNSRYFGDLEPGRDYLFEVVELFNGVPGQRVESFSVTRLGNVSPDFVAGSSSPDLGLPDIGLRAERLSATAIEISWNRIEGERVRYELNDLNGLTIQTNATRYVFELANRPFSERVRVYAFDPVGGERLSTVSTVEFESL